MPEIKDCSKIFIVDTSVLIHDPNAIRILARDPENLVVIPLRILEELDNNKSEPGEKGYNCRASIRMLDDLHEGGSRSLKAGVRITPNGGFILVDHNGNSVKALWPDLEEKTDNKVLVIAKKWQDKEPGKKVVIVSKNFNIRLKANAVGMKAEDYMSDKIAVNINELYSGFTEINVRDTSKFGVMSDLARLKTIPASVLEGIVDLNSLFPNQCCRINCEDKYLLAIFKKRAGVFQYVLKPKRQEDGGKNESIKPINDGQALLYALLTDQSIRLVTVGGRAGTGKSLIAFLAGWEQVKKDDYESLSIVKPIIEVGKTTLGFLPGTLEEKMEPWMAAVFDNLNLIFRSEKEKVSDDFHSKPNSAKSIIIGLMERGIIEIVPISHMRGRSLNNEFIIVDEAQNLSPHEVKTIVTRPGRGSKVILAGDIDQIDNPYLDSTSNGLSRAIGKLRGHELVAHINLIEGERSELAKLAANIL